MLPEQIKWRDPMHRNVEDKAKKTTTTHIYAIRVPPVSVRQYKDKTDPRAPTSGFRQHVVKQSKVHKVLYYNLSKPVNQGRRGGDATTAFLTSLTAAAPHPYGRGLLEVQIRTIRSRVNRSGQGRDVIL